MLLRTKMSVNLSIIVLIALISAVINMVLLIDNRASAGDINLIGKQRML